MNKILRKLSIFISFNLILASQFNQVAWGDCLSLDSDHLMENWGTGFAIGSTIGGAGGSLIGISSGLSPFSSLFSDFGFVGGGIFGANMNVLHSDIEPMLDLITNDLASLGQESGDMSDLGELSGGGPSFDGDDSLVGDLMQELDDVFDLSQSLSQDIGNDFQSYQESLSSVSTNVSGMNHTSDNSNDHEVQNDGMDTNHHSVDNGTESNHNSHSNHEDTTTPESSNLTTNNQTNDTGGNAGDGGEAALVPSI